MRPTGIRHDTPFRLWARAFSIRIASSLIFGGWAARDPAPIGSELLVDQRDADVLAVLALRHVQDVDLVRGEELVEVLLDLLHEPAHDETAKRHRTPLGSGHRQARLLATTLGSVAILAGASRRLGEGAPACGVGLAAEGVRHLAEQERVALLHGLSPERLQPLARLRARQEGDRLLRALLGEIRLGDRERARRLERALDQVPPLERVRDLRLRHAPPSVTRNGRVHRERPRVDAAYQVRDVLEAGSAEDLARLGAATAVVAVGDDAPAFPVRELTEARRELTERQQRGTFDVRLRPLVGLAHVEQQEALAPLPERLHFRGRDFAHRM